VITPGTLFVLQHKQSGFCVQPEVESTSWSTAGGALWMTLSYGCQVANPAAIHSFTLSSTGLLRHPDSGTCAMPPWDENDNGIIDAGEVGVKTQLQPILLVPCTLADANSAIATWEFTGCGAFLRHRSSGRCLRPFVQPVYLEFLYSLICFQAATWTKIPLHRCSPLEVSPLSKAT